MATRLMKSKSFSKNLLFSVGGVFLLFAVCFSIYQHKREQLFKTNILDASLRTYCYEIVQSLGTDSILNPQLFDQYVANHNIEGLRITIVDKQGNVLLDSSEQPSAILDNHLGRKEIDEAFHKGSGYDIKRTSASTHQTYFYSATRFGDIVVRAAVPYSAELTNSLRADNTYLYFALTLTLLLGLVLYFNTSRIGKHIKYLRKFAIRAEQGEQLDHELERSLPDDELGDICHTITSLYWKLHDSEEDKTRLKRQLTQNAAHELKTPAASIHGYLESIMENPDMPEEKKQYFIERCYAQSERMSKLLMDMTTLMRIDDSHPFTANTSNTYIDIVDVTVMIHTIIDEVSPDLERKGIMPILCLPKEIRIKGDKSLLYSVFRNIVDNALAYAIGANNITITCTECEEEGHLSMGKRYYEFAISDNGVGVSAEHLPHIFERFYRVDKGRSRKTGGTGLGLAIVKNAVAMHGGIVMAEATPGGGLTIRFTLDRTL